MNSIELIKQEDETGCGIACLAMIANKSYAFIKEKLMNQEGWGQNKKNFYTRAKQLSFLLNKVGVTCEIKKSRTFDDIYGVSILGVNRTEDGYFHWIIVIKDNKRFIIIDPKYGEVLQGVKPGRKKYQHGLGTSEYISISKTVKYIKI